MTIFGFGDSYTEGHPEHFVPYHLPFKQWKDFRNGKLPLSWMEILSRKFNADNLNFGMSGNGNQEIFEKFCRNSHLINDGDIVLINWSYNYRMRWPSTHININYHDDVYNWTDSDINSNWIRIGPKAFHYNDNIKKCIGEDTHNEIVATRTSLCYVNEIYNYQKLILNYSYSKKFRVYFWSIDDTIINNLPLEIRKNREFICAEQIVNDTNYHIYGSLIKMIIDLGGETIDLETKGIINDFHLGEKGHKIQADLFYQYIVDNFYDKKL